MTFPHIEQSKRSVRLSFEALDVGQSAQFSIQITADMIAEFAKITGDFHPLHTDPAYAQSVGFENVIAHGMLISSLSSRLVGMELPGKFAIVGAQSFTYNSAVSVDEWITFSAEIVKKDERFSKIDLRMNVTNEVGERVARGMYIIFLRQNQLKTSYAEQ